MALLEQALFTQLSGFAGLTSLVASRIYPTTLPDKPKLPAVTYIRITGPRVHTMGSDPGLQYPLFQVSAWSRSYPVALAVAEQVRKALQDFSGTVATIVIQDIIFEGDSQLYEPDTKNHQAIGEYTIWAEE